MERGPIKPKVSFLMAAHNEEKFIDRALSALSSNQYRDFEVLIGLDGCDDRTEEIVSRYLGDSRFKMFKLNIRSGKPAVIKNISKYAQGDLVWIHDADWYIEGEIGKVVDFFNSTIVGGISRSFAHTFTQERAVSCKSIPFLGEMWCTKFIMEFSNKESINKLGVGFIGVAPLRMSFPIYTDVVTRDIFNFNGYDTAADDLERTLDVFNAGKQVLILSDESYAHFHTSYDSQSFESIIRQKVRGHMANWQIHNKYKGYTPKPFRSNLIRYFISNFNKIKGFRAKVGVLMWWVAAGVAMLESRKIYRQGVNTRDVWNYRMVR